MLELKLILARPRAAGPFLFFLIPPRLKSTSYVEDASSSGGSNLKRLRSLSDRYKLTSQMEFYLLNLLDTLRPNDSRHFLPGNLANILYRKSLDSSKLARNLNGFAFSIYTPSSTITTRYLLIIYFGLLKRNLSRNEFVAGSLKSSGSKPRSDSEL